MSVDGPQLPQGQQGIGHNDPVKSPGNESGNIKTNKSRTKKIGHLLAKLVPDRAKKLFSGHRSVQVLVPDSVGATPGLKGSSAKLLAVKSLSERNPQIVDASPKPGDNNLSVQPQRNVVSSVNSGIGKSADGFLSSGSNYAAINDKGYDSIQFGQSEFIDDENGYMTADEVRNSSPSPKPAPEDEGHYEFVENLNFEDVADIPEVNEEIREAVENNSRDEGGVGETNPDNSNAGGGSDQDSSGEGQNQQNSTPDEPTVSGEEVLARKFEAYERALENNDFGAVEAKLANTNNYQTAKKVAQLALEKQGKHSLVFMIAQNRMQELKADQLFSELGGYQVGADYNLIRQEAAEMMDQGRYSKGYQERVLELVDQRLQEYETRFEGMTPFSHIDKFDEEPPAIPTKSEQLAEELNARASSETKVEEEPPPLPPRPEAPTKSQKKRKGIRNFLRRER